MILLPNCPVSGIVFPLEFWMESIACFRRIFVEILLKVLMLMSSLTEFFINNNSIEIEIKIEFWFCFWMRTGIYIIIYILTKKDKQQILEIVKYLWILNRFSPRYDLNLVWILALKMDTANLLSCSKQERFSCLFAFFASICWCQNSNYTIRLNVNLLIFQFWFLFVRKIHYLCTNI